MTVIIWEIISFCPVWYPVIKKKGKLKKAKGKRKAHWIENTVCRFPFAVFRCTTLLCKIPYLICPVNQSKLECIVIGIDQRGRFQAVEPEIEPNGKQKHSDADYFF